MKRLTTVLFGVTGFLLLYPVGAQIRDMVAWNGKIRNQLQVGTDRANKAVLMGGTKGNPPTYQLTGSDTNVGLLIVPKGKGGVVVTTTIASRLVNTGDKVQTVSPGDTIYLAPGKGLFPVVASTGGAVTTSSTIPVAPGTMNGEQVVIIGTDNALPLTVSVNGTSNIRSASDSTRRVLGQKDVLGLIWGGGSWVETFYNNNN